MYNKYYKEEFKTKRNTGRHVKRDIVFKMRKELEGDFEITNQLTAAEQKEWEDVFNLADAGDRARRKEVEEVTMVKEMNQLMYVPAVWSDDEEHNEEDTEAEETEEEEEDKEKTA